VERDMEMTGYFKKKLYHRDGGYNTDKFGAEENAVDDVKDEWIGVKSVPTT
jgi:hypothetical protein